MCFMAVSSCFEYALTAWEELQEDWGTIKFNHITK